MIELQEQSDKSSLPPVRQPRRLLIWALGVFAAALLISYFYLGKALGELSKPELEGAIGRAMHRRVHFGDLSWSVTVYGVVVHTDRLDITEMDGRPFVEAGATKVSVALLPLLQQKVLVRHLDLQAPHIVVRKVSATKWNFSDLPELPPLQDLSHVRIENGIVDLKDETNQRATAGVTLKLCNASLDRTVFTHKWPFSLSVQIPHKDFVSELEAHGVGTGNPDDWLKNQHSIAVTAKKVDFTELAPYLGPMPAAGGPVTFKLTATAQPARQTEGRLDWQAPDMVLQAVQFKLSGALPAVTASGRLEMVPGAKLELTSGHASMPKNKIDVSDLKGVLTSTADGIELHPLSGLVGKMRFSAEGDLSYAQVAKLSIQASNISMDYIKSMAATLKLPVADIIVKQPLFGTFKEASIQLTGPLQNPAMTVDAVPAAVSFMPSRVKRLFMLTAGHVVYDGKLANLRDLSGTMGKGTFTVNGDIDPAANGKVNLKFISNVIDLGDVKSLLQELKISSPLLKETQLFGKIKSGAGEISGSQDDLRVALKVVPADLYYQPVGKDRTFEITGGVIGVKDGNLQFQEASGRLGPGNFWLNGEATPNPKAPLTLDIRAQNIDLSNVKMAMAALNVQSPLMAEQLLYGTVKSVNLKLRGSAANPVIEMTALPDDLLYEPLGSNRIMHLQGGKITFANDSLVVDNVTAKSAHSNMKATMRFTNLSTDAQVEDATIDSANVDLGDVDSYLVADKTPRLVREKYLSTLADNRLASPTGNARGHFELHRINGQYQASGTIFFKDVATKVECIPVQSIRGKVVAANANLSLQNLTGFIGASAFQASGSVLDFAQPDKRTYDIKASTTLDLKDYLQLIKSSYAKGLTASAPLDLQLALSGTSAQLLAKVTGSMDASSYLSYLSPLGLIKKKAGQSFELAGSVIVGKSSLDLQDMAIKFGGSLIKMHGTISSAKTEAEQPVLDVGLDIPNPIQAEHLLGFLPIEKLDDAFKNVTGDIKGTAQIKGSLDNPALKGEVEFSNLGLPTYQFTRMSGTVIAPEWITASTTDKNSRQSSPFLLRIKSLYLSKLPVTNIQGNLFAGYYQGRHVIRLSDVTADIARGKLKLAMGVDQAKPELGGTASLTGVDANALLTELWDAPNEVTGTLDATVHHFSAAEGAGSNFYKTLHVKQGTYQITNGRVSRFGLLQRRITQANLIKGGLLDFNLNNLIQSVAPVRNGNFKAVDGTFVLHPNLKLTFNDARFVGDELNMRAGGTVDFINKTMHVDVAGTIPRVSKRGPLGPVARFFSIRGLASQVSEPLEKDLPAVSVLGTDGEKPRTFQFAINAPTDNNAKVNQSITKTFHWMTPKPNATAHPLVDQEKISATNARIY